MQSIASYQIFSGFPSVFPVVVMFESDPGAGATCTYTPALHVANEIRPLSSFLATQKRGRGPVPPLLAASRLSCSKKHSRVVLQIAFMINSDFSCAFNACTE